jgi:hypothetical protein
MKLRGAKKEEWSNFSICLMEGTGENYLWEVMETLER